MSITTIGQRVAQPIQRSARRVAERAKAVVCQETRELSGSHTTGRLRSTLVWSYENLIKRPASWLYNHTLGRLFKSLGWFQPKAEGKIIGVFNLGDYARAAEANANAAAKRLTPSQRAAEKIAVEAAGLNANAPVDEVIRQAAARNNFEGQLTRSAREAVQGGVPDGFNASGNHGLVLPQQKPLGVLAIRADNIQPAKGAPLLYDANGHALIGGQPSVGDAQLIVGNGSGNPFEIARKHGIIQ